MCGSNQAVSGRVHQCGTGRINRQMLFFPLMMLFATAVSAPALAADGGRMDAPDASQATNTDTSAAKPHSDNPVGNSKRVPFTLIGVGPRELLNDGLLNAPSELADPQAFAFPEATPARPVAIPFPTAVHLFIPGAIMAIYATRRFRGRRR